MSPLNRLSSRGLRSAGVQNFDAPGRHRLALASLGLCLALAIVLIYLPGIGQDFVDWDDYRYVKHNTDLEKGLSPAGLAWAFTTFREANWHPLTWVSHLLDRQLFGPRPGPMKMVNLAWHLANTALVFWLAWRLAGAAWPALLTAALFGLHPLHVESVAWISERKDLVCGFFGLAALVWYRAWAVSGRPWRYLAALGLTGLGLMAKPMLVTWPLVMLLLDFWPLGRLARRADLVPRIVEKLPFFALALASCVVTLIAQRAGGAVGGLVRYPLGLRLANAVTALGTYLAKTVWPLAISPFNPFPTAFEPAAFFLSLAGLSLLALAAAWGWRRRPWLAFGLGWFLITLFPVLGLVQVGDQAWASRYTYLPLVGVFLALALGAEGLVGRLSRPRAAWAALLAAVFLALFPLARGQAAIWRDTRTLFDHALQIKPDNYLAHTTLAVDAVRRQDHQAALAHLDKALAANPSHAKAHAFKANIFLEEGRLKEAERSLGRALSIEPESMAALLLMAKTLVLDQRAQEALGFFDRAFELYPRQAGALADAAVVLANAGQTREALAFYRRALELVPADARIRASLAGFLARLGRLEEAGQEYRAALADAPNDARVRLGLARLYLGQGRDAEAEAELERAVRDAPDLAQAHYTLALVRERAGRARQAVASFKRAAQLAPGQPEYWYRLGNARFGLKDLAGAAQAFERALELEPRHTRALSNLAVVLMNRGRFAQAAGLLEEALKIDPGFTPAARLLEEARRRQAR